MNEPHLNSKNHKYIEQIFQRRMIKITKESILRQHRQRRQLNPATRLHPATKPHPATATFKPASSSHPIIFNKP